MCTTMQGTDGKRKPIDRVGTPQNALNTLNTLNVEPSGQGLRFDAVLESR